jgi:pyruvate dehydrogenase E2 component (dihydrolipoamide acetyltransferase)
MPKAGISVETCIIGSWRKKAGDAVKAGDILFDYETDKASFECESTADGVLLDIFYGDGEETPVLVPVCAVGQPGEDASALRGASAGGSGGADAGGSAVGGDGGATSASGAAGGSGGADAGGNANTNAGGNANAGSSAGIAAAANTAGIAAAANAAGIAGAADASGAAGARAAAASGGWPAPAAQPAQAALPAPSVTGLPPSGGARLKASPRAKKLAAALGLDAAFAAPTGPHGRVIARDIEALNAMGAAGAARPTGVGNVAGAAGAADVTGVAGAAGAADVAGAASAAVAAVADGTAGGAIKATGGAGMAPGIPAPLPAPAGAPADSAPYADEKLPQIRKAIAAAMTASLRDLAQLTHHHSFDASHILSLRERFKQSGPEFGASGISIGDMVLFATVRALLEFPDMNAQLLEGGVLRRFRNVHLGVAVDTPRGLMVPTVFCADQKSLAQLSAEVKSLAAAARAGNISPDLLRGGTFTVSNLGVTGVESFTPIINPPQVGILGVCGITTRAREGAGGGVEAYPAMGLSVTYDHRAVDGAPASRFAQALCRKLEQFTLLLAS